MILPLLVPLLPLQSGIAMPKVGPALLPPIEAPGTRGWTPAGITPDDLARRADARLARTKNSILEWIATVNLPSGNGKATGRSIFYAPGRYRIEVMKFGTRRGEELTKLIWEGIGGRTRVLTETAWETRPSYRALPTPLAPAFLRAFDDALMRGTQGAKPTTTLVASARKAGFVSVVERRIYPQFRELRLVLSKNGGATRYAISWREDKMLPNQVAVQSSDATGKMTRIFWSCAWGVKKSPLTADDVKNFHPATDRRY